jgi:hypothetical protein
LMLIHLRFSAQSRVRQNCLGCSSRSEEDCGTFPCMHVSESLIHLTDVALFLPR